MYCTNCGDTLKPTHKFCYSCGEKVEHAEKSNSQVPINEQTVSIHGHVAQNFITPPSRTQHQTPVMPLLQPSIQNQRKPWQVVLLPFVAAIAVIFVIASVSLAVQVSSAEREIDELRFEIGEYQAQMLEIILEIENYWNRVAALEDTNQSRLADISQLMDELEYLRENPLIMREYVPILPETVFPTTRIVMRGDTLSLMTERVYGHVNSEMVEAVARYNNIANPNHLNVGATIRFPAPEDLH